MVAAHFHTEFGLVALSSPQNSLQGTAEEAKTVCEGSRLHSPAMEARIDLARATSASRLGG